MAVGTSQEVTWLVVTNAILGISVGAIVIAVIGAGVREMWSHR